MTYIKDESKRPAGGCIFCPVIAGGNDEENLVVYRGRRCFMMLNRYPYNSGHSMVLPLRHVGEMDELEPDEFHELFDTVRLAVRAIRKTMRPAGLNVGVNLGSVAGAGIPGHLHVHIVPRWDGDNNFMQVVADTHVIPELLTDTRAKLARAMAQVLEEEK